ncbi:uncharacterized protein EI90DRAFT_1859554 [Cantharellus anzutake]|uniref:uncharacterized protein n=1 Tax=Cantharellus anzutake TaxID=1750568 RepID=UPI00190301A7|nr:uncharacterized protein EI90DRAFT_1859554 [Cantharellus anzutake]KAF8327031.1 hypothetical protein EI90DRAFT_1859554 [Cantharellus anzutake]
MHEHGSCLLPLECNQPSFLACSVAILLFCTGCVCATIPHEDLARKYAPQFRLHPSEAFLPSSIEFMFPNFKVYDDKGNLVPNQPPLLTSTNLASSLPSNGQGTFLTVQNYTNALGTFLAGKNPKTTRVPVYTFIAPKGNGVVDFYYWTYYPWNQGKIVKVVGEVDDHVSDWERMSVRTVNGVAVSADYNAHSGGSQSTGTIRWADVPKVPGEDRPIGWVAQGSHGIWDSPGKHVYQNVSYGQLTDQLVDVTANGGPKWDAKANLFPMMYIPGGAYKGTFSWLSFQGKWGNRGLTNCWWYHIAPECSLVDGPVGPARDLMSGPPSVSQSKQS